MKTLYERLSEENRAKIEDEARTIPTTMVLLKYFLQTHYSWNLMCISDAMALHSALEPIKAFDLSTFIAFFDEK